MELSTTKSSTTFHHVNNFSSRGKNRLQKRNLINIIVKIDIELASETACVFILP